MSVNKGTGAGGSKTTHNGKLFEELTNNEDKLINDGYTKINFSQKNWYFEKILDDKKIIYIKQQHFKKYFSNNEIFKKPDEAYIIYFNDNSKKSIIKIIEKKNQNTEGSVEEKLLACQLIKEIYQEMFNNNFDIEFSYCLSSFFKEKFTSNSFKYKTYQKLFNKYNIPIFYGEDNNYYQQVKNWINN